MTWSPEQHREAQRRYYARKRAEAPHVSPAERAEAKAAGLCPRVYRHRRIRGATHAEAMAGPRRPGRRVS